MRLFSLALLAAMNIATVGFASDSAHWAYEGENGPDAWGKLDKDFAACESGKEQSPVDIDGVTPTPLPALEIAYQPGGGTVVNNGHTIQVNLPKGNSLTVEGKRYELLQFHFHTPSENTFKTQHAPMELHLVHKAEDGALAVIGVMIVEGKENATLEPIWKLMPTHTGEVPLAQPLTPQALLPRNLSYVAFPGSLTTPPCSEGVAWHVLNSSIAMSKAQIEKFQALFPNNARPVQPLYGRTLRSVP